MTRIRGDFNVGQNLINVILNDANSGQAINMLKMGLVTSFEAESVDEIIHHRPMSRPSIQRLTKSLTLGWRGSFELQRQDGALTHLFVQAQDLSNFNFQNLILTVQCANFEVTFEPGDPTSYRYSSLLDTYRFTDVSLNGHKLGNFQANNSVPVRINFEASGMLVS